MAPVAVSYSWFMLSFLPQRSLAWAGLYSLVTPDHTHGSPFLQGEAEGEHLALAAPTWSQAREM